MSAAFDLDAEVVRLIRAKVIELPTYPGVALQLQRVISSDNYGIEQLVRLVEADGALASHVLRAANSAFFRASTPVTTLPQAISRVGASELSNIAIAGTLGLSASLEGPLASMRRESWRRSLVAAVISQTLAKARKLDPGEAFLAGLLHDFGETIAYRTFEVIIAQHPGAAPLTAAQWQAHATNYHVELGMALAADWKLPELLLETVMRHHDGDTSFCAHPQMVEVVALTDEISNRLLAAPSLEAAQLPQVPGLTTSEREALGHVIPKLPSLLLSLDVPSAPAKPVPSLVTPEAPSQAQPNDSLELEVKVKKRDQSVSYRAVSLSSTVLTMRGSTPLVERHLVTVEVEGLQFAATVRLCTATDAGCVIELKPFALSGDVSSRWNQLVKRSAISAAA